MIGGAPARRVHLVAPLLGGLALLFFFAGRGRASEFEIHPTITGSEEYNDNVFETPQKQSDFITTIQPGITEHYRSPYLKDDLSYNFQYLNFAKGSTADQYNHLVAFTGQAIPVKDFFFVDFSENLTRTSLDVTRNTALESPFLSQADQNTVMVSPYLLWRVGEKGTLRTGYSYTDTRYWSPVGIDQQEQMAFAEFNRELSPHLTLTARYDFDTVRSSMGDYNRHDVLGGIRYQYAENCFLFGSAGYSWFAFSTAGSSSNPVWDVGMTHDFGTVVANLETRVLYTQDPLALSLKQTTYTGKLDKKFKRGAAGLFTTYTEYATTLNQTFNQRQLTVGGQGNYEFAPKLTGAFTASGDHLTGVVGSTVVGPSLGGLDVLAYPYHLLTTATLTYTCNYDVSLSLSYSYVTYRNSLDSGTGATEINRVIISAQKVFK